MDKLIQEIEDNARQQATDEIDAIFRRARNELGRLNCAGPGHSEQFMQAWISAIEERTVALRNVAISRLAMIATMSSVKVSS